MVGDSISSRHVVSRAEEGRTDNQGAFPAPIQPANNKVSNRLRQAFAGRSGAQDRGGQAHLRRRSSRTSDQGRCPVITILLLTTGFLSLTYPRTSSQSRDGIMPR